MLALLTSRGLNSFWRKRRTPSGRLFTRELNAFYAALFSLQCTCECPRSKSLLFHFSQRPWTALARVQWNTVSRKSWRQTGNLEMLRTGTTSDWSTWWWKRSFSTTLQISRAAHVSNVNINVKCINLAHLKGNQRFTKVLHICTK